MNVDKAFLGRFIRDLASYFGDNCEIVVHDYRKGFDHTIVDIVNGDLTGREVGDSPRGGLIVAYGKSIHDYNNPQIYYFTNQNGRIFKSVTTFIADEEEKIIGAVCVNLDVSDLILAGSALNKLVQLGPEDEEKADAEDNVFVNNVDDVLEYFLRQVELRIGKPPIMMNKEEKIKALAYLDQKGVFKISKASLVLCQRFNVSKYTIYSYLEEARSTYAQDPGTVGGK